MSEADEDAWLVPLATAPGGMTLVCVPGAGARPGVFGPLAKALDGINVFAGQLPGHGRRIREQPLTSAKEVIAGLAPAVARAVARAGNGKLVVFGHSMGAVVALDLARALQESGLQPDHLIVASSKAPADIWREEPWHTLPDDELVARLVALGAEPEPFAIPELRAFALPLLRADLQIVETIDPAPRTPLGCPVTAVTGTDDPDAPPDCLTAWERETAAGLHTRIIDGGHYLLEERPAETLTVVRDVLRG
jgi:surfactin synthase thioesterase subunit